MKIVNLSTYDLNGGAARASYRIHKEFQSQGIDSKMLVLHKTIDDNSVISVASSKLKNFASKIDNFPLRFYEKQKITQKRYIRGLKSEETRMNIIFT